ncbi:uncharacterized protein EV422DRAFT_546449 [Fimicolochytrium jonesii]|uniref:uncharacterized protein n=1 Tax=Fimicolochytrium jonesii TaxID=1396493 RepID=UPI0022FE6BE4|nr:uncharacterized protein EV422DRAFT_546449 [Fimicolochytrium jonesii]KAI8816201.1 hypothetical protein EV422DRAFT_546449 [Fimicolochytrium jonesii]
MASRGDSEDHSVQLMHDLTAGFGSLSLGASSSEGFGAPTRHSLLFQSRPLFSSPPSSDVHNAQFASRYQRFAVVSNALPASRPFVPTFSLARQRRQSLTFEDILARERRKGDLTVEDESWLLDGPDRMITDASSSISPSSHYPSPSTPTVDAGALLPPSNSSTHTNIAALEPPTPNASNRLASHRKISLIGMNETMTLSPQPKVERHSGLHITADGLGITARTIGSVPSSTNVDIERSANTPSSRHIAGELSAANLDSDTDFMRYSPALMSARTCYEDPVFRFTASVASPSKAVKSTRTIATTGKPRSLRPTTAALHSASPSARPTNVTKTSSPAKRVIASSRTEKVGRSQMSEGMEPGERPRPAVEYNIDISITVPPAVEEYTNEMKHVRLQQTQTAYHATSKDDHSTPSLDMIRSSCDPASQSPSTPRSRSGLPRPSPGKHVDATPSPLIARLASHLLTSDSPPMVKRKGGDDEHLVSLVRAQKFSRGGSRLPVASSPRPASAPRRSLGLGNRKDGSAIKSRLSEVPLRCATRPSIFSCPFQAFFYPCNHLLIA